MEKKDKKQHYLTHILVLTQSDELSSSSNSTVFKEIIKSRSVSLYENRKYHESYVS